MSDGPFYWGVVATNAHGRIQELTVCEEDALVEVKTDMEQRWVLVYKFPVSFHRSVELVPPEALEIAAEMRDLLWGKPGSNGPGKVVGKQHQLRALSLKLVQLLRTKEGDDGNHE